MGIGVGIGAETGVEIYAGVGMEKLFTKMRWRIEWHGQ
jgi:hypothetical protein